MRDCKRCREPLRGSPDNATEVLCDECRETVRDYIVAYLAEGLDADERHRIVRDALAEDYEEASDDELWREAVHCGLFDDDTGEG